MNKELPKSIKRQINLIPKISEADSQAHRVQSKYTKLSYFVIGFTLVLVVGFFGAYAFLNFFLNQTKESSSAQSRKLDDLQVNESILKGIEVKLAKYNELTAHYPRFPELVEDISQKTGSQVVLDKIIVNADGAMELTVSTNNKTNLENFLANFEVEAKKLNLKEIRVLELEAVPSKSYRVLLKFSWATT